MAVYDSTTHIEEEGSITEFKDFKVLNWGPQEIIQGEIPNIQPNGGAGIWIQISGGTKLGDVNVMLDDQLVKETVSRPDLITASISPESFKTPGEKTLYIKQAGTGNILVVGKLKVNPK